MLTEIKKRMNYYYFHRDPVFRWNSSYLFSSVFTNIRGMVRVYVPTMIVDIKQTSFEQTWSRSTRTKISKAGGDDLRIERDLSLLNDILNLFAGTAKSKGLRGHYVNDFDSRPWIVCTAVFLKKTMLAGHIWIVDPEEKRCLLFVNASAHYDSIDRALVSRAHYYLLWQDGLFMRKEGMEIMDLNGYDPDKVDPRISGVYSWKEGTHGKKENRYHYYPVWFYLLKKIAGKRKQ